ncbi:hypothetical protein KoPa4_00083 [Pseudomonas phage vB_PpuM-KoPa-4]|uniref:Holin n=1 Tax=Pseudomonas phage vB_PpuM-KoPa-4 TaxID=3132618 RepID=A0AAX4MZ21_9CAUD
MFLALIVYITMVVLPFVVSLGGTALFVSVIITGILGLLWLFTDGEAQYLKTWLKSGWLKLCIALAVLGALTPNKEVTWYIVGAYAAEKVATADATKELAGETYEMFRDLLKKARENINETDAAKLKEKAGDAVENATKAFDNANKAVDNADNTKQGEKK